MQSLQRKDSSLVFSSRDFLENVQLERHTEAGEAETLELGKLGLARQIVSDGETVNGSNGSNFPAHFLAIDAPRAGCHEQVPTALAGQITLSSGASWLILLPTTLAPSQCYAVWV